MEQLALLRTDTIHTIPWHEVEAITGPMCGVETPHPGMSPARLVRGHYIQVEGSLYNISRREAGLIQARITAALTL